MTDPAIIAASYAAEVNYSHTPDDVINASDAVGAWGTTKESTTKLVDISGNNNVADIHGAMPTEGFIRGRRFDGDDDYLNIDDDISLDVNTGDFSLRLIISTLDPAGTNIGGISKYGVGPRYYIQMFDGRIRALVDDGINLAYADSIRIDDGKIHDAVAQFDRDSVNGVSIFINGVDATFTRTGDLTAIGDLCNNNPIVIGRQLNFLEGKLYTGIIYKHLTDFSGDFNTLARLPFWSVNYTDYPDNVAEYTDNLPYSSSIISSGTFKVDDDKLQCVSAGTMTYSASYNFDGSEYITATIAGVEYAGTGTITQGNTTVSVAQGSNKITITMGTGDTIEGEIGIQFRAEV